MKQIPLAVLWGALLVAWFRRPSQQLELEAAMWRGFAEGLRG